MKNAEHICHKCIYKRLRLQGLDIYFKRNNNENTNFMKTMFDRPIRSLKPDCTFFTFFVVHIIIVFLGIKYDEIKLSR